MHASVKFARKSVLSALAGGAIMLASFLSSVILARTLGVAGTGEVAYVVWLVLLVATVADMGVSSAVGRYVPEMYGRGDFDQAWMLSSYLVRILALPLLIVIACISGILLLPHMAASWRLPLLGTASSAADAGTLWVLVGAYIVAQVLGGYTQSYLRGAQDFATLTRIAGLALLLQLVGVTAGSLALGVEGAIAGYIAGQALPAVYALGLMQRSAGVDRELWCRVRRYAAYAWAANLANAFVWARIEVFFLQRYWDSEAVGLFTVALTLSNLAAQGPALLTTAALSLFSEQYGRNDIAGMRAMLATGTRLLAALAFPACFGAAAIMPALVPFIYGHAFVAAVPAAVVLVCVAGLGVTAAVSTNLVNALERNDFIVGTSVVGAVLALLAGLLLVPHFGLMGAAVARAAIQLFLIAAGSWFVVRRLGYPLPMTALTRLLGASLFSALTAGLCVLVIDRAASLLAAIPAGIAAYIVALRVLQPLPLSDITLLNGFARTLPAPLAGTMLRILDFVARPILTAKSDLVQDGGEAPL